MTYKESLHDISFFWGKASFCSFCPCYDVWRVLRRGSACDDNTVVQLNRSSFYDLVSGTKFAPPYHVTCIWEIIDYRTPKKSHNCRQLLWNFQVHNDKSSKWDTATGQVLADPFTSSLCGLFIPCQYPARLFAQTNPDWLRWLSRIQFTKIYQTLKQPFWALRILVVAIFPCKVSS